jgi:hypothetical protein
MLGLNACAKKQPPSGAGSAPGASQPAASAPAPAAAKINAAEFFTKADAEAVLGKSVSEPAVQDTGSGSSNVTYIASDLSGIGVYVGTGTSVTTFDGAQAKSKAALGADPVPVANVGEKAYWTGGKANQLNVLQKGYWIIVTIPTAGDNALDLAKKAAEKVLARIP